MKFASSLTLALVLLCGGVVAAEGLRDRMLREAALEAGLVPIEQTWPQLDPIRSQVGKLLFESTELSLSRETSCQACHLDRFASADGLPLGIGTKAQGEGHDRIAAGVDVLPRNTLALWGRGGIGFETFFWDGKVEVVDETVRSQFGDQVMSSDPLVVAAHLPMVEIREMVPNDETAESLKTESLASGDLVYSELVQRVRLHPEIGPQLAEAYGVPIDEIGILHITESLATFIRDRFRLRATPLHDFVFGDGTLTEQEVAGGLLFYGRGRCLSCHNGPYFSDFSFHAIPAPQLGNGRNGFGVDYGRFNVTHNSNDIYRFRTPPLYNVTKTGPYSHSGAVAALPEMIRAHVDPLADLDVSAMTGAQRGQFYQRLAQWANEPIFSLELSDSDIENLVAFLGVLDFPHKAPADPE